MSLAAEDLVLGPREISFSERSDGDDVYPGELDEERDREGSVLMTLRTLALGEVIGWADIELDGQTTRLETHGPDELKVTYDLTLLAGAWLIETAEARGLVLFAWGLEPVERPVDVFKL